MMVRSRLAMLLLAVMLVAGQASAGVKKKDTIESLQHKTVEVRPG